MAARDKDAVRRPKSRVAGATVAAGYTAALFTFAVSKGADRRQLLMATGLAASELADPDARLPFESFKALMRAAQGLTGDPALALRFGAESDLSAFSIVGLIADASDTMAHALQQLNRYGQLVVEVDLGVGERFQNVRDAQGMWLVDLRHDPNGFPELTESTFARIVSHSSRFGTADQPFVIGAQVTHPAPVYRAEYERILGVPVAFDCNRNALLVDASWINRKISQTNHYAFGVLSRRAAELLESLAQSKTTRGEVERLLIPVLHTGDFDVEQVAAQLGMSRKTLYRKLKAESATFERVLDELRQKMARHYLDGKKVSVNETAYLTGFSDRSTFARAYKRWTGKTPRAKRA